MIDTAARFRTVREEFDDTVRTLKAVLTHIEATTDDALIRVVMLNSTIVAVSARVEETIRELVAEYLMILQEGHPDHRWLRKNLQKSNLDAGAWEISEARKADDPIKAARIAMNLEKCFLGKENYELHVVRITFNQANFKSKHLTEVVRRTGLEDPWRGICDDQAVEDWTAESSLDRRIGKIVTEWNEFFEERDTVVHNVSQARGWGAQRINEAIDLCALVIQRLAECLRQDADSLLAQAETRAARG